MLLNFKVSRIDEALSEYIDEERREARAFAPEAVSGASQVYRKCPQCNQDLILRRKKDNVGFFFSCMGYPECKVAIWLPATVKRVEIDTSTCPTVSPTLRINIVHTNIRIILFF